MSKIAKQAIDTRHSGEAAEGASTAAELLVNWNSSLAEFYARRLSSYWKYPMKLMRMRSLEEVAQSLTSFQAELLSDYAEEARELERIASGKSKPDVAPSRDYEARLLKAQKDAAAIIEQAKAQAERIVSAAEARAEQKPGEEEASPNAARKRA
jgi:hypothetical protein